MSILWPYVLDDFVEKKHCCCHFRRCQNEDVKCRCGQCFSVVVCIVLIRVFFVFVMLIPVILVG